MCHNCRKPGHLLAKCPNLHPEVRKYLALGFAQGRAAGLAGQDKGTGGRQVRVDGDRSHDHGAV